MDYIILLYNAYLTYTEILNKIYHFETRLEMNELI